MSAPRWEQLGYRTWMCAGAGLDSNSLPSPTAGHTYARCGACAFHLRARGVPCLAHTRPAERAARARAIVEQGLRERRGDAPALEASP